MPQRALTPCRNAGCARYAEVNGYCREHRQASQQTYARGSGYARTATNNRRFMACRKAFLSRHPICASCRRAAASVLDHIVPHRGVSHLFWSQDNWQGLCVHCHGVKTANESWGYLGGTVATPSTTT